MTTPHEIDMLDMLERLTRLETEHKTLEHQHQSTQKKLDTLITRFDKYEAKWGGVFMVVSAVGAVIIAFKAELIKWLAGR